MTFQKKISGQALFVNILLLTIVITLFSGCDKGKVYEENFTVDEEGWNSDDFLRYSFSIEDTTLPYHFFINLRNNTEYPYSNLFLFIRTILPDQTTAADTLDIPVSGPDGKWYGNGIGRYRDLQVLIMNDIRFPQPGEYIFEIEQGMRDTDIKGISSVGIRVEKAIR